MRPNWQLIGVLVIFDIYNPGQKSQGHSGGSRGQNLRPNWGPKGRKIFFWRHPPPPQLFKSLDDHPPPLLSLKVWSRHIFIFLSFLGSLLKQCIFFEIFLQFSLPPPYTKLKLETISGYTSPTLFVRCGEGLDLCELENAPEIQKCSKTFVHDWRFILLTNGIDWGNHEVKFYCMKGFFTFFILLLHVIWNI